MTETESENHEQPCCKKIKDKVVIAIRVVLVALCLYLFICSINLLGSAFRLLGGKHAGEVFRKNEILSNPIAGLMIGVLVTVLVQSSSTSTSIVISMVGADILEIKTAIPIVMGANIGTSLTNTIVACGLIGDKDEFSRAFAGATVHDMFNWLAVIILLPLEIASNYLYVLSSAAIRNLPRMTNKAVNIDLLNAITKPFTERIIQIHEEEITNIAINQSSADDVKLMKTCCDRVDSITCCRMISSYTNRSRTTAISREYLCSEFKNKCLFGNDGDQRETCLQSWFYKNSTNVLDCDSLPNETSCREECEYLFKGLVGKISEEAIGAILAGLSLFCLCSCLLAMVKLLHELLRGQLAVLIKKFINAEFPGRMSYFTGYIAILLGAGLTILVQSSSIFTSTLTPLVGMGVIEIDRMYPLTLGANIGTTTTGILSALAQDSNKIADSLQVAFCHLFFNISGILIFYPLPFFRPPIPLAKFLGNQTAKYRWFALVYIFCMFFIFPALVFALSIPGWYVLAGVLIPIAFLISVIVIVNILQNSKPHWLPGVLRNWDFLPEPLRSLEPLDRQLRKLTCSSRSDYEDLSNT